MKLSNAAEILSGYPFRGAILEDKRGNARVVQMKDTSASSGISWNGLTTTTLPGKKKPNWLSKGDILFAARGTHNYAVHIDRDYNNVVSAPHFYILRAKNEMLLPEFLTWLINQKPVQNYFKSRSEGSRVGSIRRAILEKTEIVIPPIARQEKILKLHKTLQQEKQTYKMLIKNTDQLMGSIASEIMRS